MTPEVGRILSKLKDGAPITIRKAFLTHARIDGTRVSFCTTMKNDPIQRNHRRGHFYEQEELGKLKALFPEGGTFVDIGANVGNHTLYAGLFLKAGRVVPVEPNPLAYALLVQNVLLNRLEDVVTLEKLGVGLSDKPAEGFAMEARRRNLGGAKMLPGEGQLSVVPGDALLEGEAPDLIKIDVEGMEMLALGGLEKTISRHRPVLLVEVDNENEDAFMTWAAEHGYEVTETVQRYRTNKNHLLRPKASASATPKKTSSSVKKVPSAKTSTRKTSAA